MSNLTRASRELFRRGPDEYVVDLTALAVRCREQRERSQDRWQLPGTLKPVALQDTVGLKVEGGDGAYLNNYSFGQLCKLSGVSKETLNKLTAETAARALAETLPVGKRPTQLFTEGDRVRSIHGVNYQRLYNAELVAVLQEFAVGFAPPPKGLNGATGLYMGEEDLFAFLIDPDGWCEVGDQAFAAGFFVWNSEVGRRSVGVQTFWFQQVCQNHIVWDAINVVEKTWKHTSSVQDAVSGIRRTLEVLVEERDRRRDGFVRVLQKAMTERLGDDAEEAVKELVKNGIPKNLGQTACEEVARKGERFTVWALVDALTAQNRELRFAGDRTEADERASRLLSLVAA